jgi:hypothetical protein
MIERNWRLRLPADVQFIPDKSTRPIITNDRKLLAAIEYGKDHQESSYTIIKFPNFMNDKGSCRGMGETNASGAKAKREIDNLRRHGRASLHKMSTPLQ